MSALVLFLAAVAVTTAPPPPPKAGCDDAQHQAVFFWVGDWTVTDTASGVAIAQSRIEKIVDGCGIKESFDQEIGPGNKPLNYHGTSYTALSRADGRWRQFYVDTGGAAFSYVGDAADGTLTLTATATLPSGTVQSNRMIVRAQPDGTVRQTGELSLDGGQTWAKGYDFTYRRR